MNKIFLGVAVVGLVFLGVIAFGGNGGSVVPTKLGAPQAYQALNNQNLLTELQAINAPLANIPNGVTAAIDFPNMTMASATTTAQATTTSIAGVSGALGDQVLVQPVTPTTGATFVGYVSTASTTTATITIVEEGNGTSAVDATSTLFNVIVIPQATFKSSGA